MAFKVTIGQYYHGDSLLHKLDPRVKIACAFICIVLVFFASTPASALWMGAGLFALMLISRIPFAIILRSIKPLIPFMVLTAALNLFFIKTGDVIFSFLFITITQDGLRLAIIIALRFFYLMLAGTLVALTTSPISLTDAIEEVLKPFQKLGLPAHEIAMILSIALRFIPTLVQEADRIMKAQAARGASFDEGSLFHRAKTLIPLVVPLFASSLRHANNLATAMEARCYEGGENRTRYHVLKYEQRDFIAFALCILFFAALIALRISGL